MGRLYCIYITDKCNSYQINVMFFLKVQYVINTLCMSQIKLGGICPGGMCPGGMCPGGMCPGGKCPGGKFPGGFMSRGKCPGGTCSGGFVMSTCFFPGL